MAEQSFFAKLRDDPAVKELLSNVGSYATAKGEDFAKRKMPGAEDASGVIDAGKKQAKREAVVPAVKGFFKGAWAKLTGKAKGSKGKRPVNILETAMVGAPIEMVWDAWRDFEQWPNFMKGPERVEQGKDDDADTTNWTVKIFLNRRQWKSTVTEQVDYERIRWKSEGNKGTVDGVVTFTPAGENLTFVVLVLEYRSKGLFEIIGKTWRVQGRRARLDFKHFQRHIAMADQADALRGDESGEPGSEQPDDTGDEPAAERSDERDESRVGADS